MEKARIRQRRNHSNTECTTPPTRRHAISRAIEACRIGAAHPARAIAGCSLGLALAVSSPGWAATFTVTNTNDAGPGSLRQAVINANNNPGLDDIAFSSVSGTINLTSGEIEIKDSVSINGPGADVLTVDASDNSRIFYTDYLNDGPTGQYGPPFELSISGLTLTGANPSAVYVYAYSSIAHITIDSSVISGNNGSGVVRFARYYETEFSVRDSDISNNQGVGIGQRSGTMDVQNSVISGNKRAGIDAGTYYDGVGMSIENSEISNNGSVEIYGSVGIRAYGSVDMSNSIVSDNTGGGVFMGWGAVVDVKDSVISNNTGAGVYGYLRNSITIHDTTVSGNHEGVDTRSGESLEISGSTINGNTGAGIASEYHGENFVNEVNISNSTISSNTGGGIRFSGQYPYYLVRRITNTTIVGNSAQQGGGIFSRGENFDDDPSFVWDVTNSVVAGNTATNGDPDLSGEFRVSYSLIEDPGSATIQEPAPGSNLFGQDPQLGPLQDNGGPTPTHALLSGSPAVDSGDPGFSPPPDSDQRGLPRVVNGRVDMGAYELQGTGRIGDFVWDDMNGDGIQDAGEPGIEGATVRLQDCAGNRRITRTTDADGGFDFAGLGTDSYRVQFQRPTGFDFSPPLQGAKRGRDSNADPATGLSACLSMPPGKVRLGIDAGLVRQSGSGRIGDFVWQDVDGDGIQDAGEPGFQGVTVRLLDCTGAVVASTTTGSNGGYVFDALVAGDYRVGFVAPTGYAFSLAEQGNRRGRDSNADPATGLSACLSLSEGQFRRGIDAGLVATGNGEIGDFVWRDSDGDGIQGAGEPGFEGVTVRLRGCAGELRAITTTDAQGAYRFDRLAVGSYKVEFVAPDGYVLSPRAQGNRRGRDSDPFPNSGLTQCLNMPEGKVRLGIDAGMKFDPAD